jgi:predicted MFS family arabinose efflux permease
MLSRRRAGLALVTLAASSFIYVTGETFPVGLLPQLAASLRVSESSIGLLVTVFAGVVALTAVPLVLASARIGRRALVVATISALTVSMLVSAIAPNYPLLLAARLIAALGHGVFWSILAPIAVSLVPRERHGRATAMVFAGGSLSLVLGTPSATALGQWLGWRAAAAIVGGFAALCAVCLRLTLPSEDQIGATRPDVSALSGHVDRTTMRQLLRDRQLLGVCAVTLALCIGNFTLFTYIDVFIERDGGIHGFSLAIVLLANGIAGLIGNLIAGRVTDRRPRLAALSCAVMFGLAVLSLGCVGRHLPPLAIALVLLWGAAITTLPVIAQGAVLRVARGAGDVASSLYVVAFQIGIAGGALLGAGALDAGVLADAPFGAAALAVVAVLLIRRLPEPFPTSTALVTAPHAVSVGTAGDIIEV